VLTKWANNQMISTIIGKLDDKGKRELAINPSCWDNLTERSHLWRIVGV